MHAGKSTPSRAPEAARPRALWKSERHRARLKPRAPRGLAWAELQDGPYKQSSAAFDRGRFSFVRDFVRDSGWSRSTRHSPRSRGYRERPASLAPWLSPPAVEAWRGAFRVYQAVGTPSTPRGPSHVSLPVSLAAAARPG